MQTEMRLKVPQIPTLMLEHFEETLAKSGYRIICGVDEVGRGPLAGPVVAAAVIFPEGTCIDGLTDSKLMSPAQRDEVFEQIAELGLPCAIGVIDHETIDRINILKASLMAMRKAVMELTQAPDCVVVDGLYTIPKLSLPQFAVVKGDQLCKATSAASVVAKVTRDVIMDRMEKLYPAFSFSHHKGYGTPAHLRELREHGPCDIHRKTFGPVAELLHYALL